MKAELIIAFALLISCSNSHEMDHVDEEVSQASATDFAVKDDLTPEQEASLEALNAIQTKTDQMNRLYSTFPNLDHDFYPEDTSFIITQSEFLFFMTQFVKQNCTKLPHETQISLAQAASLAEDEYTILFCREENLSGKYENGIPMRDVWVIQNLLGLRDVIIKW